MPAETFIPVHPELLERLAPTRARARSRLGRLLVTFFQRLGLVLP
jgi:hypothetical protein